MMAGAQASGGTAGRLLVAVLCVSGCVAPVAGNDAAARPAAGPLRVTNAGAPFANDEGAAARKVAEATCAAQAKRLVPSIYDRYDAGAWVYVEGCA